MPKAIIRVSNTQLLVAGSQIRHVFYIYNEELLAGMSGNYKEDVHKFVHLHQLNPAERGLAIRHIMDDLKKVITMPKLYDTDADPRSETLRREIIQWLDEECFSEEREADVRV